MHHIVSDHWSIQIFRSELELLYEAFSQGRPSPLAELEIQFADFAVWERSAVSGALLQAHLSHWTGRLSSPSPQRLISQETKPEPLSGFHRSRQPIDIDETSWLRLRETARRESATPFMVVLTALSVFLHLTTGDEELRIGTLVANRRRETEKAIGHFVNTVILCLRIEHATTCKQLLRQVRQMTLSAFANQELPFEWLARVLEEERHVERRAIFQVLLSYQTAGVASPHHSGLKIAPMTWQQPATEINLTTFNMIFTLREMPGRLVGGVNYGGGIPGSVVARVNGSLNSILRQLAEDIEALVSKVTW
jgi:hypothetical protein